jgi:hypothetical protein
MEIAIAYILRESAGRWAGRELHRIGPDLIVVRDGFDPGEKFSGLGLEKRDRVVFSGEAADGIERVEKVDHHELGLTGLVITQEVSASIAGDGFQSGENFG